MRVSDLRPVSTFYRMTAIHRHSCLSMTTIPILADFAKSPPARFVVVSQERLQHRCKPLVFRALSGIDLLSVLRILDQRPFGRMNEMSEVLGLTVNTEFSFPRIEFSRLSGGHVIDHIYVCPIL